MLYEKWKDESNGVSAMLKLHTKILIVVVYLLMLGGCVGARTFHEYARAGDTVAVAAGRVNDFSRDNITVTITPSSGSPIVYAPNNPAVRAVVNLYPDPLSSLLVSYETQQDLTPAAQTYGSLIVGSIPNHEKDWWQTSVFVNLPTNLPVGTTSIEISNPSGEYVYSEVEIVNGTGAPNTFFAETNGPLNANQLASMERLTHFTVDFSAGTIPFGIQVDLSHSPDVDHGGTGRAYVVNPRGDLKNVTWSDTGTNMRVIILPAKAQALSNVHDYKFYVAGGVTNLTVLNVKAVDINGNNVTGVTAMLK
jgi:hypothetical protein